MQRWAVRTTAGVTAAVLIGLLVVQSPPVRRSLVDRVTTWFAQEQGLRLTVDDLRYNVLTRHISVRGLTLATPGHEQHPLFKAREIDVRVPWGVFAGRVDIQSLTLADAVLTLAYDATGVSNLPPSWNEVLPTPETPERLDLRNLTIRRLGVVYLDAENDLEVRVHYVRADLSEQARRVGGVAGGTIAADRGMTVRMGQMQTASAPVTGHAAFDGSAVTVQAVAFSFPEADVTIDGRIDRVFDTTALNLRYSGTARLAAAAPWVAAPMRVDGTATLAGTLTGPLDAAVVDGTYASSSLVLGLARNLVVTGRSRITTDTITLAPLTLADGGGVVDARVDVPFDDNVPITASARWRGVPLATALAVAGRAGLPVAATLEGRLAMGFVTQPAPQLTLDLDTRARAVARRGAIATDGRVMARVANGRWRLKADHHMPDAARVVADLHGTFNATDVSQSSLSGPIELRVTSPESLARSLARAGITVPAFVATSSGQVTAALQLGGRLGDPAISGTVASDSLVLAGAGTAHVRLSLSATPRRVDIRDLRAAAAGSTVVAEGHADLRSRAIGGGFRVEAAELAHTVAIFGDDWRASGHATATGSISGTIDQPSATATLRTGPIALGAQHVDAVHANLEISADAVGLRSIEVSQGDGRIRGAGRYQWTTGAYAADIDAHGVVIEHVLGPGDDTRARVDLTFSGTGTVGTPFGQATASIELEGGAAGAGLGRTAADVTLEGSTARFTAFIPGLGTHIRGAIEPRAPFAYRAVLATSLPDLDPFARLAGARADSVRGSASASTLATGRLGDTGSLVAHLNLLHLAANANGVPVELKNPVQLRWAADGLRIDDLRLGLGAGELRAAGHFVDLAHGSGTATLQAEAADLLRIARVVDFVPAGLDVRGALRANWTASRGLADTSAALTITDGTFGWGDLPPARAVTVDTVFDGSTVEVTRFTAAWQDGRISATARIPRAVLDAPAAAAAHARGSVKAQVTGLTHAALAPWVDRATLDRMTGRLSATVDAEIAAPSLAGVRGALVIDEAAMTVDGLPVQQRAPTRLTLADGRLRMEDVRWTAGGSPLALDGTVDLGSTAPVLGLGLTGTADLRILSVFAPTMTADGSAQVDVRLTGTAQAPQLAGAMTLSGAELAMRDPQVVLSGVSGLVQLDGQRLEFRNVHGDANGGRLAVTGGLDVTGLALTGGGVDLQLTGVALDYPPGLHSEADATLRFTPGTGVDPPHLTGRVRILRSAYLAPISLSAMAAGNLMLPRPIRSDPAYVDAMRLNVAVETVADMVVDNNYGRFEAGSELRLTGSVGFPGLTGRTTLREGGQVYVSGNTFRIERGSISFISPTRIEPDLDIRVGTRVSAQDVSVTLGGPLDRLETNVSSSDPTIPADELVALLLGGAGRGLGSADAVTLLSAELLGATSRAVGLDSLRIERGLGIQGMTADPGLIATETDPSARLTLSKRLRPDVEVTLSQNLRKAALSTILTYRPRKNVDVRGISRDNLDRSYSLRHELTFGGGQAPASTRAIPRTRVSSVTVTVPGHDGADLTGRLRLGPGDRFDFQTWQADVDRLRRRVRDRGYLEARVRATRHTDNAAGTTALTYQVDTGPATTLEIVGYRVPAGLRTELERVWTQTVLDQFLVQDMEERTQAFLIGSGLLGSVVRAQVEQMAHRKTVRLTIEPGARIAGRDIRFDGGSVLDDGVRLRAITMAGLGLDAWVAPDRLRRPLEDLYVANGYLDARIRPGRAVRDGDRAVLVVGIDEGPRYTVGTVAVDGVAAARRDRVRTDAALLSGAPYTSALLDGARRRVEDSYRREGFNAVRVEAQPAPDRTRAVVDVRMLVDEGPRQVLAEVVDVGRARTRADVVERALGLRPGAPVDLDEWALARKRLYDTGVFSHVDIQAEPGGPPAGGVQQVRARVTVREWPAWRLRYGLQWNDERADPRVSGAGGTAGRRQSAGAVADLRSQNLWGRAVAAGLSGSAETAIQTARVYATFPRIVRLPVTTSVFLFGEREEVKAADVASFITVRTGVSTEQRWQPARTTQVAWTYRLERNHTYDPHPRPDDEFPLDVLFDIARLGVTAVFDHRDDEFETRRGWFSSVSLEYAAPAIGSDLRLAKAYAQQKFFRPIGPVVLAAMVQAGTAFGDPLIPSERFYAGGAYTVRGYAENSLGPVDYFGAPRGGDALLVLSQEVRIPVVKRVNAVAFLDAGNVFATRKDVAFGDLNVGYGLGLRLDTPFALMRIDYGRALSPGAGDRRGRWYVGIGHVF